MASRSIAPKLSSGRKSKPFPGNIALFLQWKSEKLSVQNLQYQTSIQSYSIIIDHITVIVG